MSIENIFYSQVLFKFATLFLLKNEVCSLLQKGSRQSLFVFCKVEYFLYYVIVGVRFELYELGLFLRPHTEAMYDWVRPTYSSSIQAILSDGDFLIVIIFLLLESFVSESVLAVQFIKQNDDEEKHRYYYHLRTTALQVRRAF